LQSGQQQDMIQISNPFVFDLCSIFNSAEQQQPMEFESSQQQFLNPKPKHPTGEEEERE
jgi:hypothetical protein